MRLKTQEKSFLEKKSYPTSAGVALNSLQFLPSTADINVCNAAALKSKCV